MEKVTNRQIFFIILISILSSSTIINLPAQAAALSGTGGWVSIAVAALMLIIPLLLWIYLGNLFPEKTLADYSGKIVGKSLSKLITIFYTLYFILLLSLFVRQCSEYVKNEYLPMTPIWAIILVIVLTCSYSGSKNITDIGRIVEFSGLIVIVLGAIIHTIMITQGNLIDIMPLYEPKQTWTYLNGSVPLLTCFIGFEVLSIIPFNEDGKKKRKWYALGALFVAAFSFIFVIESSFSILSVEDSINYKNSLFLAIREVKAEYLQLLSRIDIIFIFAWMFAIICEATLFKNAIDKNFNMLINSKKPSLTLWSSAALVFILANIPLNHEAVEKYFRLFAWYFSTVSIFVIPLILFIVVKLRKLDRP